MPRLVAERADTLPALAEIFREHGYEGASLALISERTGLGKGSLYHFFPGGKEEMAAAVLAEIGGWFGTNVFRPLREEPEPRLAIERMLKAIEAYFHSGQRICLVGAFALGDARDRFAAPVRAYFVGWKNALAEALMRCGHDAAASREIAEEVIAGIQGALVLARAMKAPSAFQRSLVRLRTRLEIV